MTYQLGVSLGYGYFLWEVQLLFDACAVAALAYMSRRYVRHCSFLLTSAAAVLFCSGGPSTHTTACLLLMVFGCD